MISTKDKNNNEFDTQTLLAALRSLDITYDDSCKEVDDRNLSGIEGTPISILNLKLEDQRSLTDLDREDTTFLWKTLLIDCLIRMDYNDYNSRDELVQILKKKFYKDNAEDQANRDSFDQFNMTYEKSNPIRWYTENSCIFKELNIALRRSCINMIFAYRFFLRDLEAQLRKEHKSLLHINNENTILYLYRGQGSLIKEIKKLQQLKSNCLNSVDCMFSTTRSDEIADEFMQDAIKDGKLVPLRYEIECDLGLKTKAFADISSPKFGDFSREKEVLFMVGTIFQFKKMFYSEKLKYWIIQIKLIDEDRHHSYDLYKSIQRDMGNEPDLLTLGRLLVISGDYEHASRMFMRSLFDLPAYENDMNNEERYLFTHTAMAIASVQSNLGRYDKSIELFNEIIKYLNQSKNINARKELQAHVYYSKSVPLSEKGKYLDALKQCKTALRIFTKYYDPNDNLVANCYEMIGNIYAELGRLERIKNNINGQHQYVGRAFNYYNKALKIRKKIHKNTPNHYEINITYANIGELFRDIGKSDEALKSTLMAYISFVKAFPKSHNYIGIILDNIGEIYVQQQRFTEAKEKYNEAIDVYEKTLPSDHRFIGETLHNIGKL